MLFIFIKYLLDILKKGKDHVYLGNSQTTGQNNFWSCPVKKGKRKVQGLPQSQTAALPRPQEEEETDKSKQAQTEQMYEKH